MKREQSSKKVSSGKESFRKSTREQLHHNFMGEKLTKKEKNRRKH